MKELPKINFQRITHFCTAPSVLWQKQCVFYAPGKSEMCKHVRDKLQHSPCSYREVAK